MVVVLRARGSRTARDATARARLLLDLWQAYRHQAAGLVRSPAVLRLVDELFASPFLTANRARDVTGLAYKNAQNIVDKLAGAGLLREMTGQKRNRVYVADDILKLLDQ